MDRNEARVWFIARGDAPKVFYLVDETFDEAAFLIEFLVVGDGPWTWSAMFGRFPVGRGFLASGVTCNQR
jgi:hypothetical protein